MPLTKFDRDGILYLRGTVKVGKKSRRVYESSGVRAGDARANERFNTFRITRESEILDELLYGERAVVTWTDAAAHRVEKRRERRLVKRPDLADQPDPEAWYVLRLTDFFRERGVADKPLGEIAQADIDAYFATIHAGHALSTKMRELAAYKGVMNSAKRAGWISKYPLPSELPEQWDNLSESVEKMLFAEEVLLFVHLAVPHFKPLIATAFGSGRRTGELLHLSRTRNLRWQRGNESLFLGVTKNGKPIYVKLAQFAVDAINEWLKSRQDDDGRFKDRHDALFLTDKGKPYSRPKRQRGGLFKTAMAGLRKRVATAVALWLKARRQGCEPTLEPAIARLVKDLGRHAEEAGMNVEEFLRGRIKVLKRVTGHWGRHNAASHLYDNDANDADVMDHLGWKDVRSPRRYRWRSKKHGQRMAAMLDFGAKTVHTSSEKKKSA